MATIAVVSPRYGTGPATAVTQVVQTMADMKAQVDANIGRFDGVIASLLDSGTEDVSFAAPNIDFTVSPPTLQPVDFSPVDYSAMMPSLASAPSMPDMTINLPTAPVLLVPDQPVMEPINIPAAPSMALVSLPARPLVDTDVVIPAVPVLNLPIPESLLSIEIPTFTAPVLATFDETAPLFDAVAPNVSINWVEPIYDSESFDATLAVLSRMRLGGTGLMPAIEQQIFERSRAREDRVAAKASKEAIELFAARGFVAPPGALQAQLNMVSENNQLQTNALQRETMIKIADVEIENMRFSVTQGLAAEQILVNIFNNYAQRSFEMAKFTVESLLAVYNTKVSIFNALMSSYQTKAQVYKTIIDGQLASLQSYKLQLDGAKVTSEVNQQRVQTYEAQVRAVMTNVEVYKVQLQGVQAKVDVAKTILDSYKTDVSAYAETIGAEKVKFDAYKSQVEGEQAKAKINESRASVFSTLVQGEQTKANIWKSQSDVELERLRQVTNGFTASIEGYRANVASQLGVVQAHAETKKIDLQARTVQNTAVIETNRSTVQIGEMRLQSNLSKANTSIKLYEVNLTKLLQQKDLQAKSLQAAGQMLSTLVGGAMSAQHVQASISSSSGSSESYSESVGNSLSESI